MMCSVKVQEVYEVVRLCTQTEGDENWLHSSKIAYVHGAELRYKVFHYLSFRLQVGFN